MICAAFSWFLILDCSHKCFVCIIAANSRAAFNDRLKLAPPHLCVNLDQNIWTEWIGLSPCISDNACTVLPAARCAII